MKETAKRKSAMDTPAPTSFREAERLLKAGTRLSAQHLASLLEGHPRESLPDVFRNYLIGMLRQKAFLPRGPKKKDGARRDFTIADVMELYEKKLLECRDEDRANRARARSAREVRPRAESTAHERAAQYVLEKMKVDLGNMGTKRLLNIIAEWKWREVPPEDEIPPDDLDPPDHEPEPKNG
jgi:hypothetical protein